MYIIMKILKCAKQKDWQSCIRNFEKEEQFSEFLKEKLQFPPEEIKNTLVFISEIAKDKDFNTGEIAFYRGFLEGLVIRLEAYNT